MTVITFLIGLGALLTGLACAWPQAVKIVVKRTAEGVSGLSWMLRLFSSTTWLALGLVNGIALTIVYNFLGIIGILAVLLTMVYSRAIPLVTLLFGFTLGIAFNVVLAHLTGSLGINIAAIAIAIAMYLPQAWSVLRSSAEGVSFVSWVLALASATLWGVYGILIGQLELAAPCIVLCPVTAFIIWHTRPQSLRATTVRAVSA